MYSYLTDTRSALGLHSDCLVADKTVIHFLWMSAFVFFKIFIYKRNLMNETRCKEYRTYNSWYSVTVVHASCSGPVAFHCLLGFLSDRFHLILLRAYHR
jgi:hypothetical protein